MTNYTERTKPTTTYTERVKGGKPTTFGFARFGEHPFSKKALTSYTDRTKPSTSYTERTKP